MTRRPQRRDRLSVAAFASLAAVTVANPAQAVSLPGFFPGELHHRNERAQGVDRFGDPSGNSPSQCGVVTYCGGPVISNVQFVPVFWTDQVAPATTAWAEDYAKGITNSALMDMLSEYSTVGLAGVACGIETDAGLSFFGPATRFSTGQSITRGTAMPSATIVPTMTTGTSIVDDNGVIGTEIVGQIAAGHLPAPTYDAQGYPNTLYVAFFPQNYNISLTGLQSCQDFGGYHNSIAYTAPTSCKGQYLPYAVIVDCGEEGDQLADIVSHELAEAVTDTDVGTYTGDAGDGAWYLGPTNPCILGPALACPMNCGEVADVCEAQGNDGVVPGSAVTSQDIWSQAQNNCALSNPGTPQQSGPTQTSMTCTTEGSSSSSGGGTTDAGVSSSGSSGGSSSGSGSSSGGRGSGGLAPGDSGSVLPEGGSGADPDAGDGASSSGSSGCGCSVPEDGASRDAGWIAGLLVLAWLCRGRRSKRV